MWPRASANLDFADERCARLWIIHKVVRKRDAMQPTASKEIESVESVRVRVFACVQLISRPVRPRVLFKRCYLHLAFGSHSASPAAVSFKLTTHTAPPVKANYTQQQTLKKRRLRRHRASKRKQKGARAAAHSPKTAPQPKAKRHTRTFCSRFNIMLSWLPVSRATAPSGLCAGNRVFAMEVHV
jgi:hypothetical protein